MTDMSKMSDAELEAIAGTAPPASAPDISQPRGYRNRNPGNIEDGDFARSLPGYMGSDGRFATFDTMENGRAAHIRLLRSYGDKRGLNTVTGIVGRWAPKEENDTGNYVQRVAQQLGVQPDQPLDMQDDAILERLAGAMGEHENGRAVEAADLSDAELEAMASAPDGASEAGDDPIGDVEFVSAPQTARRAGAKMVYGGSDDPITAAQEAFYEAQIATGKADPAKLRAGEAPMGSEDYPSPQRDPADMPKPGDWYLTPDGEKKQVPAEGWGGTAVKAAVDLVPMLGALRPFVGDDRRYDAMKRGAASGLLVGGRNEAVAGIESLVGLLQGAPLKERFLDVLHDEDRKSGQARRDFPIAYDASAVGGALAGGATIPTLSGARAATLLNAGVGGAGGFLATDGDLGDRSRGAAWGVVGGAVLPAVASKVARGVMDMTGVPMRAAKGTAPEVKAATALDRAIGRDEALPADIPLRSRADGALPFQAGGDNLVGLAEVLAQSPGKGQAILRDAVRDQQAAAPGRVKGAISKAFGGKGDYFDTLDALKVARSDEAKSGMEKLGQHLVTLDRDSVSALRSDLARSAIKEQAQNSLASPDPVVREAGARLNRLHDDLLDKPGSQTITVRDAQNISKSLLDAANAAYAGGQGARGAALKELGKSVRTNAATPDRGGFAEYGAWLKKYGEDSDGIEALDLGRKVFGGSLDMSAARLRKTFAGWSDGAKENYRLGVGEALLDAVRRKGGVTQARQLLKNEEFADRLRVAVPDNVSFDDFMSAMEREVKMANHNNRVVGGSPTYARAAGRADLEAQGRDPLDVAAEAIETGLSPARLTAKALKATLKGLPRKDRSVIGDPTANAALAKALVDPDEMTKLLNMLESYRAKREIPLKQLPGRGAAYVGSEAATN